MHSPYGLVQFVQPKSNAFYNVFVVRAVFQLLYCCYSGETKTNLKTPAIVSLANF